MTFTGHSPRRVQRDVLEMNGRLQKNNLLWKYEVKAFASCFRRGDFFLGAGLTGALLLTASSLYLHPNYQIYSIYSGLALSSVFLCERATRSQHLTVFKARATISSDGQSYTTSIPMCRDAECRFPLSSFFATPRRFKDVEIIPTASISHTINDPTPLEDIIETPNHICGETHDEQLTNNFCPACCLYYRFVSTKQDQTDKGTTIIQTSSDNNRCIATEVWRNQPRIGPILDKLSSTTTSTHKEILTDEFVKNQQHKSRSMKKRFALGVLGILSLGAGTTLVRK